MARQKDLRSNESASRLPRPCVLSVEEGTTWRKGGALAQRLCLELFAAPASWEDREYACAMSQSRSEKEEGAKVMPDYQVF